MGAEAHVMAVSPELLQVFLKNPALVEPFVCCYPPSVAPGTPENVLEALLANPMLTEMRNDNVQWLREEAGVHADALVSLSGQPHLYLDKAWFPLREFLVSVGASADAMRSIMGGEEIGPNLGYERARYLRPEEVASTATALDALCPTSFPHPVIRALFDALKAYYAGAASRGQAVLQHLA